MANQENQKANPKKELAGSFYHPSYYLESDDLSKGIATSHEQVSDAYTVGEIGAVSDDVNGKDTTIPQNGFEKS